jgi:hypothetical protein
MNGKNLKSYLLLVLCLKAAVLSEDVKPKLKPGLSKLLTATLSAYSAAAGPQRSDDNYSKLFD